MDKKAVYLLSEIFDYSKRMYNGDCGEEYAQSIGLNAIKWKSFLLSGYNVAIFDTRLQAKELSEIYHLVSNNLTLTFIMTVTDPYYENETNNPYIKLLFDLVEFSNVKILSKYQPEEVVKELAKSYTVDRFLTLNYSYDPTQELPLLSQKKNQIVFSGATYKEIYPERFIFLKRTRRTISRFYIKLLKHPGYPDTGGSLTHDIIGVSYIKFLSQYRFMFISPSRCGLEFLKYREAAYAGILPIGLSPKTFSPEMKHFFYEVDVNNFSFFDILKLLLMSQKKHRLLVQGYRDAFNKFRSKELQKSILNNFINQ